MPREFEISDLVGYNPFRGPNAPVKLLQPMRSNRTPLFVFGFFAALLGVAVWYVLRPGDTAPLSQRHPEIAAERTSEALPSLPPDRVPPAAPAAPAAKTEAPPMTAAKTPPPKTEIAQWEYRIDEALRSQADHSAIALSILSQVPAMPGEGQAAAAQHIANLISDKDYLQVLPYIKNSRMEAGFQEIIVAESLNRPDEVKLPVLLSAARTPKHPMAETALSVLSVLLDANFGNDWTKWEAAVNKALNKVTPNGADPSASAENANP